MGNFQSQNTEIDVTQELSAGCSQSFQARAVARAQDVNIENVELCGDLNIANVRQEVTIPRQDCAVNVSVQNMQRATNELQQTLRNIPLGFNAGAQNFSQTLNQRIEAYCNQSQNVEAVADAQRIQLRNIRCGPNTQAAINIASANSTVAGVGATQCTIGVAAKAISDVRNSASQVNEGFNPMAFLENMTQGVQILMILAGVAAAIGAIAMAIKAKKKPEDDNQTLQQKLDKAKVKVQQVRNTAKSALQSASTTSKT